MNDSAEILVKLAFRQSFFRVAILDSIPGASTFFELRFGGSPLREALARGMKLVPEAWKTTCRLRAGAGRVAQVCAASSVGHGALVRTRRRPSTTVCVLRPKLQRMLDAGGAAEIWPP